MAQVKKEEKVVILLRPQEMEHDYEIIKAMMITKMGAMIDRSTDDTNMAVLKKYFPGLPTPAKEVLVQFKKEALQGLRDDIKSRFSKNRAGVSFETYQQNSLIRSLHSLLESFKPYRELVPWYHTIRDQNNRVRFSACTLSGFKPGLQFKVDRDATGLTLQTFINMNGTIFALDIFNRYHFLLESNNEYFLLSHKDYQTLEWLTVNQPGEYSKKPDEFAAHILSKLEADYPVNRNQLFEVHVIDVVPENRVMLSEISQSFLVLTPQWFYDGFLVDSDWKENHEVIQQGKTYLIRRNLDHETAFKKTLSPFIPISRNNLTGTITCRLQRRRKSNGSLKCITKC